VIMVSREHEQDGDNSRWHHHDSLRSNRIGIYQSIMICAHANLLLLSISVKGAEVDIA
jgi:hypothetical protein